MYKYEMGPTRTVGTTKRTRDVGRMDGRTDGVKPIYYPPTTLLCIMMTCHTDAYMHHRPQWVNTCSIGHMYRYMEEFIFIKFNSADGLAPVVTITTCVFHKYIVFFISNQLMISFKWQQKYLVQYEGFFFRVNIPPSLGSFLDQSFHQSKVAINLERHDLLSYYGTLGWGNHSAMLARCIHTETSPTN